MLSKNRLFYSSTILSPGEQQTTTMTSASHTVPLMVVVFGRPGAGKTTVSEEAVRLLKTETCSVETAPTNHLHLDLDVCVPQWMRVSISHPYYVNSFAAWH